jgi:predicted O-methyltransferase YrrM
MKTLRFNTPSEWNSLPYNYLYTGMLELLLTLKDSLGEDTSKSMIEIGSYMGESTMMFASVGIFDTIHSIEPHNGSEEFNKLYEYSWEDVKKEYKINTRNFDNIIHHQDYSYNVVDKFEDGTIDFIYIDAEHTYESVKRDLELYLPKLKKGGIIGGHDYHEVWPGVCKAVDEKLSPITRFIDTSWIYKNKSI